MKIQLTRDSVCAGDDGDAPHEMTMELPDGTPLLEMITEVVRSRYLASIAGGLATWSAKSGHDLLAIVAQQWAQPKLLPQATAWQPDLHSDSGAGPLPLQFHFQYHQQQDPDTVYDHLSY